MFTIRVYIDNGVVYEYDVKTAAQAREHASAIAHGGYRHNNGKGDFVEYPARRIAKVRVTGGRVPTMYPDRVSGT